MTKNKVNISFRIWFYTGNEKFLGKGRVELLERIDKTGSISSAAKGMKMSYRQAWQMVNEMNERASEIVVEKSLGGKGGGGATITKAGEKAIQQFHEFEKKVAQFIADESKNLNF
ncbi:MAG: LysR family transcriptional regulator [Vicingaceae bacterium]|nr:LysR family transcriptional regulator [Vicingaceae bacterium]